MPETIGKKPNKLEVMTLSITLLTIYIVLLAHATAASYRAGYLSYFDVSIDAVPFWPKISDFMSAPLIALIYVILFMLITLLMMVMGNLLYKIVHEAAVKRKMNQLESMTRGTVFTKPFLAAGVILGAGIISFSLSYSTMQRIGENTAAQTKTFAVLTDREVPTLLIYQHDGTGIVKEYNFETKEFSKRYEVIELTGQKFERLEIPRE